MAKMTAKQKRFCDEYLIDLNATQAAIRAGYSEKTAGVIATENLQKPIIQNYISERMSKKESELIATQDEVLQFLTEVMRGKKKDEKIITTADGECVVRQVANQSNQIKAAELLGKRYGIYTDRLETDVDMDLNISIDYGDDSG
jgi:phage terminase small subunit